MMRVNPSPPACDLAMLLYVAPETAHIVARGGARP